MKNTKRNITALLLLILLVVVTIVVVLYLNNKKERIQTREEVSKIEVVEDRNKEREEKTLRKSIEEEEEREEDKEQIDNTERNREEEESLYRTEVEGELTEEYRDEILSFTYYSDWKLETHTGQERCTFFPGKKVNVKCYFIYEPTNRFFLSIKLVYDIDYDGGGIFTDEKLGDYGVIQMDEYFLYRPEYFNYSSDGIPDLQLYFIDNREPKVGDFNYNWKQRGNYRFIVTYVGVNPNIEEIDKKILEEMDRIVESVKFLD